MPALLGGFWGDSSRPVRAAAGRVDQSGRGLLVRVTDEDDRVAAHVDETLSLGGRGHGRGPPDEPR